MKTLLPSLAAIFPLSLLAAPCLPVPDLIGLDRQYEEALRGADVAFLRDRLADGYVWVHSLGSQVETRDDVIRRLERPAQRHKSRTTADVHAHTQGDTVVLRGLSTVEQWNADGTTFRANRYQFMRTYVNVGGRCKLLAVQTMKVWSSEGGKP
jgi:ketosteroid isomerase-like protein